MSSSELENALNQLPPLESADWPFEVRKYGVTANQAELDRILKSEEADINTRFAAFYLHQIALRHNRDYTRHKARVKEYYAQFRNIPMFTFLRAQSYGDAMGDPQSRETAVILARRAAEELPHNSGVWNQLAEYLVESVELEITPLSDTDKRKRLLEAEAAVSMALSLKGDYAKYHSTKGRILSLLDSDLQALQSLDTAINLEDGTTTKGDSRIQSYQIYRREVTLRRIFRTTITEQNKAVSEFRSLRSELLSLLGLLAAVVAFISTTATAATSMSGADGLILIMGMSGAIIVVFSVFAALFIGNLALKRAWAAGSIGVLLIVGSAVLTFL